MMRLLLFLYAVSACGYSSKGKGPAYEEILDGTIERVPGEAAVYNYVAFMSIPGPGTKTCSEIFRHTWRQALLAAYAKQHTTNYAVCSPKGYNYEPDTCACRYCPRLYSSLEETKHHNHTLDCVSRAWMRRHPPRVSLGIGSGGDSMYLLDFYNDTARAPIVLNIPVANEDEDMLLPSIMKFDRKVDAVLLMSDVEKGEAKILCGEAHSRSPRCKETLDKFFAAVDDGEVPMGLEAGACELIYPGTTPVDL